MQLLQLWPFCLYSMWVCSRELSLFLCVKLQINELTCWLIGWSCEAFTPCPCHQRCRGWRIVELFLWDVPLAGNLIKLACFDILNCLKSSAMTKKDLIDWTIQFILMVAASSVGEELFYRAAVQVCLGASASALDYICQEMSENCSLDKLKMGNNLGLMYLYWIIQLWINVFRRIN